MEEQNLQNEQNEQSTQQPAFSQNNYQDNTGNIPNQNYTAPVAPKQTNALAIVSLVMGIFSIVVGCCGWFGIVFGIVGIVCAVFANKQEKSGLAKAGMICSIVGIVIALLVTILSIVFGAALMGYAAEMGYHY